MIAVAMAASCDGQRHLVGEGSGAVDGANTSPDASLGSSDLGVASGGSDGGATPPNTSVQPRPLTVGARQAVTRLARLLWEVPPDAALLALADSGALVTTEDVRMLALRMLEDDRTRAGVGGFYRWWLDLEKIATLTKDPQRYPRFTAATRSAMAAESETFGIHVTLDDDALFTTLLTAPFSFLNEDLAEIYGVAGVMGSELRRVALDPAMRAGLFTQPGLLAMNSNPVSTSPSRRGTFLNQKLLCRPVPSPPPDVTVTPPEQPVPATTTRELVMRLVAEPTCAGCHALIDPIGFGYENFDAVGYFRVTENGLPIDSSGQLPAEGMSAFNGPVQLAFILASHPEAQECMTKKWLEYAIGRSLNESDTLSARSAHHFFRASGFNLREVIAGVGQTDSFLNGAPVCTPGRDQTCNDNPMFSSIHGHCTEAARCVCTPPFVIIPATGRCS
jgi:hypothetical protein